MPSEAPVSAEFARFPPLTSNFTPTPNVFFDYVLPNFPSCVVSVVGAIIRATLGWTDSLTGEKRIEAELSVPQIARLSGQAQNSVRKGIRQALDAGLLIESATPGAGRTWIARPPPSSSRDGRAGITPPIRRPLH